MACDAGRRALNLQIPAAICSLLQPAILTATGFLSTNPAIGSLSNSATWLRQSRSNSCELKTHLPAHGLRFRRSVSARRTTQAQCRGTKDRGSGGVMQRHGYVVRCGSESLEAPTFDEGLRLAIRCREKHGFPSIVCDPNGRVVVAMSTSFDSGVCKDAGCEEFDVNGHILQRTPLRQTPLRHACLLPFPFLRKESCMSRVQLPKQPGSPGSPGSRPAPAKPGAPSPQPSAPGGKPAASPGTPAPASKPTTPSPATPPGGQPGKTKP